MMMIGAVCLFVNAPKGKEKKVDNKVNPEEMFEKEEVSVQTERILWSREEKEECV